MKIIKKYLDKIDKMSWYMIGIIAFMLVMILVGVLSIRWVENGRREAFDKRVETTEIWLVEVIHVDITHNPLRERFIIEFEDGSRAEFKNRNITSESREVQIGDLILIDTWLNLGGGREYGNVRLYEGNR